MDKKISSTNKPFLAGIIILVASLCAAGVWIKQTQKQVQAEQDQLTRLQKEEEAQLQTRLNEANAHYLAEANRINAANADGRKIQVKLNNYGSHYSKVVAIIYKALEMVPGASNVRKRVGSDTVVYTLNYKGETEDLADFLEKHIKVDIPRRSQRPVRGTVSNTCVEFDFE